MRSQRRVSEKGQTALTDCGERLLKSLLTAIEAAGTQFFASTVEEELKKAFESPAELKRLQEQIRDHLEGEGGIGAFVRMVAHRDPRAVLAMMMRPIPPQRVEAHETEKRTYPTLDEVRRKLAARQGACVRDGAKSRPNENSDASGFTTAASE